MFNLYNGNTDDYIWSFTSYWLQLLDEKKNNQEHEFSYKQCIYIKGERNSNKHTNISSGDKI